MFVGPHMEGEQNSVNFISCLLDSFHMPLWALVPLQDARLLSDVFSVKQSGVVKRQLNNRNDEERD